MIGENQLPLSSHFFKQKNDWVMCCGKGLFSPAAAAVAATTTAAAAAAADHHHHHGRRPSWVDDLSTNNNNPMMGGLSETANGSGTENVAKTLPYQAHPATDLTIWRIKKSTTEAECSKTLAREKKYNARSKLPSFIFVDVERPSPW